MAADLIDPGLCKPLDKRKLLKATCEHYGYTVGQHNGRPVQIAPYYHMGQLCAQHLRYPDKSFSWLGKAQRVELFGQRVWAPGSNTRCIIAEGEIDAMSFGQAFNLKVPCLSIPSGSKSAAKSIGENLEYLNSFQEIVLAFDNDEPGQEAVQECVALFKPGVVKLFRYPEGVKDANELLQQGLSAKLLDGVFNATPYRPDGIIAGEDLWSTFMKEDPPGYTTPYPALNKLYQGFRKGELYLFTAGSGVGKSTLVHEIGYHFMMEHNLKLGVLALEESKKKTVERYVGINLNKPLSVSREGVDYATLERAFKATVGNLRFWLYDHWGSTGLSTLLGKLRFMAVGLGVDWIILDHISIIVSGIDEVDNERRLIDNLMTKLRSLIEETGVGVMAIVHLKRTEGGKEGKNYNEGKQVRLTDLRGSGALEQLSDAVISLERDQQGDNPDVGIVRALKNRPIGKTGVADTVVYDHDTGRLLPNECAQYFKPVAEPVKAKGIDNPDF